MNTADICLVVLVSFQPFDLIYCSHSFFSFLPVASFPANVVFDQMFSHYTWKKYFVFYHAYKPENISGLKFHCFSEICFLKLSIFFFSFTGVSFFLLILVASNFATETLSHGNFAAL